MIDSSLVDNNPRVREFKKQAKILLRQLKANKTDITLRACHDLVAQQHGYKHWYEFHKEIKNIYESQTKEVSQYFFKATPLGYMNYGYNNEIGLKYCLNKENINHTLIIGEDRKIINLHLAKQAIEMNEHIVYLDGDGIGFDEITKLAISAGRQKDIRTISFAYDPKKLKSDTLPKNLPGSSGHLTELFVSLMDDYGTDAGMWKGRAISLMSCIMMALVYMRDKKEISLTFETIREYLILDNIINLYKTRRDFPNHIQNALRGYLVSLPSYKENSEIQNDTVLEQHGYLQMQFTMILGTLSDSYGYLFSDKPDLQYSDLNGKNSNLIILFKYPPLHKSTDEIGNLAKLIMLFIKNQLEFDKKPHRKMTWFISNCPIPRGFAVVPAQAKINNIEIVFSYEDKTLLNSNKEEALSIAANCNLKIDMNTNKDYSLQYKTGLYSLNI